MGPEGGVVTARLETDQPNETVRIHRPLWLPGVTFWGVADSVRHWAMHHDTYTCSLVLGPRDSMRASWRSRGESRVVAPGAVQMMNPGEAHCTTAVSEPASFFVVWWAPETMAALAAELGVRGEMHFAQPQLDVSLASDALRGLQQAVDAQASRLEIEHFLLETTRLLAGEDAAAGPRSSRRHHPGVRRAIELMRSAVERNLSLDELANVAGLSKFHLARCFRDATGLSPHHYQRLLRLQSARRLLEAGSTVEDAALCCGFADGPHLTRQFRGWLGVAPGQWARFSRAALAG